MFLKTEQFEYNGVSVTLSELSALQRFDYIKFVSDAEQQETTKHDVVHINQRYLETASLLVAMSLWHSHSLKGTLASPETCLLYTNPHPGICDVCQSALGGLFPS
ncbi:phage minor tail protein domain-containing protein, partial [Escherichia coli]|uniref:phage minor tail protein domain-containing protein n=1 Tax=Escherichia coli TaxID=562 RepID=UPI00201A4850